jgi:cold shock CspA family protein
MPIGVVQFFIASKGYGFIKIPETREEIYFKEKKQTETLNFKKGMKVSFKIIEDRHGLEAVDIQLIPDSTA